MVKRLRAMMSAHVGVVRDDPGLAEAVRHIATLEREATSTALRNMATSALLVAASALSRRESRGAHFRIGHPTDVPALAQRTMTDLAAARAIAESLSEQPLPRTVQPMID
jgi:L-aspartate oxidase